MGKTIIVVILLGIILYNTLSVIFSAPAKYFSPDYTESVYKGLENMFNHSQYRQKKNPGIIPDEVVFSYAAGAYLKGVDPILINSEHTPLGKYFISLSILLLKNDVFVVIPFTFLTLFSLFLLGKIILGSKTLALIPVALLSFEVLFMNQIAIAPLLDIIQLPFIFFALYFFLLEYKKRRFILTSISIGFVIATKTIVPGVLLIACFSLFLLLQKQIKSFLYFLLTLPIALVIFVASYARTFLNSYTIFDFIGFQKWIFLYQQSKLIYPFSFWKLVLFNQWQTWWGKMEVVPADDWGITWPIFTLLPFLLVILVCFKKVKITKEVLLVLIWIFIFELFLSLGVVSSRFLLPLLPVLFIVGIYTLREIFLKYGKKLKI